MITLLLKAWVTEGTVRSVKYPWYSVLYPICTALCTKGN